MTRKQTYESQFLQQLSELDVPDVNESWEQMKMLLEKKKKRRPPFLLLSGCALWGLLLFFVGGGLFITIKRLSKPDVKKQVVQQRKIIQPLNPSKPGGAMRQSLSTAADSEILKASNKVRSKKSELRFTRPNQLSERSVDGREPTLSTSDIVLTTFGVSTPVLDGKPNAEKEHTNTLEVLKEKQEKISGTVNKQNHFSAGIAMNQKIPLGGQTASPYGFYGRRGSLSDYLPSVYVRYHHGEKWYAEAGFRYGAPQLVREFDYSNSKVDSFGASVTRKVLTLKKTFYHQVPISLHYYLTPAVSISGGLVFNKFFSAISDETLEHRDLISQRDSILSKKIVATRPANDSFFMKSVVNMSLGIQYEFRRFSTGMVYTSGLQPYIKYPSGNKRDQSTNHSLQLFITYRLWQSRKH